MSKLVRFLRLLVPQSDVVKALSMAVGTVLVLLLCGLAASAMAKDVAEWSGALGRITLTDENAGCEKYGTLIKRARLTGAGGGKFEGCFARVDKEIWILWDDGDRTLLLAAELVPASSGTPS